MPLVPVDINSLKLDNAPQPSSGGGSGLVPVDINSIKLDQPQQEEPYAPEDYLGDATNVAGRTARILTQGAMAIPGMLANVPALAYNSGADLIQGDNQGFRFPDQNIAVSQALDKLGVPKPQGTGQKIADNIAEAVSGVSTTSGLGNIAKDSKYIPKTIQQLAAFLAEKPGTQVVSAIGATGSGEGAKVIGLSPAFQSAATLAGGFAAPAAADISLASLKGIKALAEPLTESGQQNIVGRALNRLASDPEAAQFNLNNIENFVPNSNPATGTASKDYGLISLEKAVRNIDGPRFAELESNNNTARQNYLNTVAGDEKDIDKAIKARDRNTTSLREWAFDPNETKPAQLGPVKDAIYNVEQSPQGGSKSVEAAMQIAKDAVERGGKDPARLYESRKDIADAIKGLNDSSKARVSAATPQLMEVQSALDTVIENAAPGYKDYMKEYANQSKPIDQMTELQKLRDKSSLAAPDTNGMDFLSQGKWSNYLNQNREKYSKILTSVQRKVVDDITQDLDRGATLNNSAIKPAGSSTFTNLSTANLIGAALGGNTPVSNVFQRVLTPIQWLYKIPEQQVHELLVDAAINPLLAKSLMAKPTAQNVELLSKSLGSKARAMGYGDIVSSQIQQKDEGKK